MFAKFAIALLLVSVVVTPVSRPPQDSKRSTTRKSPPIDKKKAAWSLSKMDNWVRKLEVATMESAPPQFALNLYLWMPSPGWQLSVDSLERQKDGRILVKVTGKRPKGMAPAVMTETKLRVPLGFVEKGEYLLDVWGRFDKSKAHRRRGMALLQATGR